MFIPTYKNKAIVNSDHIISVGISNPYLEQKDYTVVATLTYGSAILHRGDRDSCDDYLGELYRQLC